MLIRKLQGLEISSGDGQPLGSGNHHYWDAQFAKIVAQRMGDYLPEATVSYNGDGGEFTALFHRQLQGRERCWRSRSFQDPGVKISSSDVDDFLRAVDALHAKAESSDINPDTATWIRGFSLPHPVVMPEAWRSLGGNRKFAILWGYTNGMAGAQILPLTPTSSLWPDARNRTDIKALLYSENRIGENSSGWWRKLLYCLLGVLVLALCVIGIINIDWSSRPSGKSEPTPGQSPTPTPQNPIHEDHKPPVSQPGQQTDNGTLDPLPESSHCDIHPDVTLRNGICPRICGECGSHLSKNGGTRCENTCDLHEDMHKKNGLCPKCDPDLPPIVNAMVELIEEREQAGRFFPEFRVRVAAQTSDSQTVKWVLDDKPCGYGAKFSVAEGFAASERHIVGATVTWVKNGRELKAEAQPYVWAHELPDAGSVERNLAQYGGCRVDPASGREFFTVKLFSQPEDNRATVTGWEASLDGETIAVADDPDEKNAVRIFKSDIKRDGRIRVVAHVAIQGKMPRDIERTFMYRADILSAEGIADAKDVDIATTIKKLYGPSVLVCYNIKASSTGTAFAITTRDFITNRHVVEGCAIGDYVALMPSGENFEKGVRAKIMEVSSQFDVAHLQTDVPVDVNPFAVDLTGEACSPNGQVFAMGYPHWQHEASKNMAAPDLLVTAGVVESVQDDKIFHTAPITHGNSGGPLVNMNGILIGINTGGVGVSSRNDGEQERTYLFALKASCINSLNLVDGHTAH